MTTHQEAGFGRSIVFIPPLGGTADLFSNQLAEFKTDHRCIAVTLRGNGDTEPLDVPVGEVVRSHAAEVVRLLEGLGVPRAHVVGVGYGGAVAQQLAIEYPMKVRSLVLTDTWAELTPNTPADQLVAAALRTTPLAYRLPRKLLVGSVLNQYLPWPEAAHRLAEQMRTARLPELALQHRSYTSVRYAADLHRVQLPALVLAGERARHLVSLGRQLSRLLPQGRLETIPHSLEPTNLCQPALFNEAVRRFLTPLEVLS
ncbi:alpha/beta fold hydrolase [Naumannella sp. ID2617S]|uniref:AB hydrolase-1 domain-containing protein n=1 Tax=Enemella dayhoffiae TaxID=2016507 RepID=A0A255GSB3_9ACTN|nr:alpha/beta hydrolase [Enemella dayhoffiae]NNG20941.1 alpha/beta fold hydrolase [Naumannella sp. ID2617S]OYO18698.1 hypothetical protein CGZ93_14875 [Enemella dayhoffiae]